MRKPFWVTLLLFFSVCGFAQQDYVGRYDVFGGFSYLDSPKLDLQQRGFNIQIGYNAWRWLALGVDYSYQNGHAALVPSDLKSAYQTEIAGLLAENGLAGYNLWAPFDATTQTFAGGPQLVYRHFKKVTLFVHPSIGAIHEYISIKPHDAVTAELLPALVSPLGIVSSLKPNDTTYFYGFGGGADFNATKHLHLRADIEFVHVDLFSDLLANSRNSVRLSIGPSFNFGKNVRR